LNSITPASTAGASASLATPTREALAHELGQRLRHGERLRRVDLCTERTGDLKRVERVAP
jgi:hypothetical protein